MEDVREEMVIPALASVQSVSTVIYALVLRSHSRTEMTGWVLDVVVCVELTGCSPWCQK